MRFHPLQTLSQLESLSLRQLDRLTQQAVRQLSTRKLLLGRCLVALDLGRRARKLGCSSSIHYARLRGVEYREALEVRRVAGCLEKLPKLRTAAEEGSVAWSSLREIVRKATAETEARWLELAGRNTYRTIEKLVRATKRGEMPGDATRAHEMPPLEVVLRLHTSHVAEALLLKAARKLGETLGRAISLGEALEWLCVHYLAGEVTEKARDLCTREILKDIAAQFATADPAYADAQPARAVPPTTTEVGPPAHARDAADAQPARAVCGAEGDAPRPRVEVPADATRWQNNRLRYRADARLTRAQRREIQRRDGYCCATPGCPNRLWLDVHHVLFFSQGGPSLPENLILLCSACHGNVHEGWLIVIGEAPDHLFWFDPEQPLLRGCLNDLEPEEMLYRNVSYDVLYEPVEEWPREDPRG